MMNQLILKRCLYVATAACLASAGVAYVDAQKPAASVTPDKYAASTEWPTYGHAHPVRFRNVWVRRLAGYDQPEKQ